MKVSARKDRLDAAGATAVFVTHDDPAAVRDHMLRDVDCPFPVAVDRERAAYRAWGLRRVPLASILLDPKVWYQYARLLASGERLRRLGGDYGQLGGDFVVDRSGVLAYARPQRRDDRPPVGRLVETVEALG